MWRAFKGIALGGALVASVLGKVHAGEADVQAVDVRMDGNGRFVFAATVAHADAGWSHYADGFDIVGPDGTVFATRVLAHPHDHEQPFTRSIGGVRIPDGVAAVMVRAHDNVHEYGGAEVTVALPGR